jgi:hypothetical protein
METLRVGAAFPDPPFNGMPGDGVHPAGLDIDLMTAIAESVGATVDRGAAHRPGAARSHHGCPGRA